MHAFPVDDRPSHCGLLACTARATGIACTMQLASCILEAGVKALPGWAFGGVDGAHLLCRRGPCDASDVDGNAHAGVHTRESSRSIPVRWPGWGMSGGGGGGSPCRGARRGHSKRGGGGGGGAGMRVGARSQNGNGMNGQGRWTECRVIDAQCSFCALAAGGRPSTLGRAARCQGQRMHGWSETAAVRDGSGLSRGTCSGRRRGLWAGRRESALLLLGQCQAGTTRGASHGGAGAVHVSCGGGGCARAQARRPPARRALRRRCAPRPRAPPAADATACPGLGLHGCAWHAQAGASAASHGGHLSSVLLRQCSPRTPTRVAARSADLQPPP